MKKIIATAVAAAFAVPVYAADITISGDQEFSWLSNNGTTTADVDGDFNVKASTETANGISVSADINIREDGGNDGSASLTLKGPFGSVDLGDANSAVDSIDDTTDFGLSQTIGSENYDAAVNWTLPSLMPGLSVYVSVGADGTSGAADGAAGTGVALKYSAGPVTVGYGQNDYDNNTEVQVVNATFSTGGLSVAVENQTITAADGTENDIELVGVTYSMGDLTVGMETRDTTTGMAAAARAAAGVANNPEKDVTLGVHICVVKRQVNLQFKIARFM
jgi:hypothetical protein